jgi:hypothetical protein
MTTLFSLLSTSLVSGNLLSFFCIGTLFWTIHLLFFFSYPIILPFAYLFVYKYLRNHRRRSYEITNFMMTNKEAIPSFFKHLRDTNLMDIFIKLVEKETTASPLFKDYDPKKAAELPADDTRFWTDTIPENILAKVAQGGAGEDTEWTDVEIDSIAHYSVLVLEKFTDCKLAHQLRDMKFCSALIARTFDSFAETQNGAANGTKHGKAKYRHQSTVVALLSYITQLLKFCANTSAYSTDTIPPLVACLIYGSGGKRGSRSSVIPVSIQFIFLPPPYLPSQ